jgi:microcystin-dependent protein
VHRIDEPGNNAGQFSLGNPATGTPATRLGADWPNAVQEEICTVIEAAGLTLEKGTNSQLLTALNTLMAAATAGISASPVGSFLDWPLPTPPEGYLRATGAEVSRAAYPELFAVIGERHGAGDGSTTFNLPDRRGLVARGWDDGAGRDLGPRSCPGPGFAASSPGDYQADAVKSHRHELDIDTSLETTIAGEPDIADVGRNAAPSGHYTRYFGESENLVKNVSTNWCIKYQA